MANDIFNILNEETQNDIDTSVMESARESSLMFLSALREEFPTTESFTEFVKENATEMELYGLIDNAQEVMEAYSSKMVVKFTKAATFNRQQKRACITLARANNDPNYKKYAMHRAKMIEAREAMYDRYGSKAAMAAKKSMMNAKKKASSMNSSTGNDIVKKMDKQIKKLDNTGRNGKAISD